MALGMLLDMAAEGWPDRRVLGSLDQGWTPVELRQAACRVGAELLERGARSVAFLDVNGPGFVLSLWAAALAGLPFCPLNYRLSAGQVRPLIEALDEPVVVAGPDYRGFLDEQARAVLTEDLVGRARSGSPDPRLRDVSDDSTAVLLFTSGTTSAPKAVVLRHVNLVSYVLETVEFGSAGAEEAILVCMPPYHVAGVNGALSNLYSGRRLVHLPNFGAAEWLRTVRDEGITHAMVVPTMLARIVEVMADSDTEVPTLRSLAYGGARMPRPVLEAALRAFPGVDFVNAYGLTETSSTIALLGPDDHRAATNGDPAARDRLGSVGRLVPGIEAEIRDQTGAAVPDGASGELWLRGPQISGTYLGKGSALDAGGWFPTRDRAHVDADGYLFIEGRVDDTIIRGGENVAPAEIEEVLVKHPAIADAAVVGLPDDHWGERIVAVLVPRGSVDVDPDEVREFVRRHLRGSRTPDEVAVVDSLPYSTAGKLVRRDLVARLRARSAVWE